MLSFNHTEPITLRTATGADEPFLKVLYASTRQEELALLDWSEAEKGQFLEMQFRAQHLYYHTQFPQASFQIIECRGAPIGRLYTDQRGDVMRVIDIALLPEHRRKGIGSALMRQVLTEAATAGKPVRIHVERFNPALQLYEGLGFQKTADQGVYWLMEWVPAEEKSATLQPSAEAHV